MFRREVVGHGAAIVLALIVTAAASELPAPTSKVQNSSTPRSNAIEPNPLTEALRTAFVAKNPAVTRARILELRSIGMKVGSYILLGWGIRPDTRFQGRFDDELFGVFIVDPDLTRIERTLDIFPTRRWADYTVSIEELTDTEVTVVGRGSTYGDQQLRQVYRLGAAK